LARVTRYMYIYAHIYRWVCNKCKTHTNTGIQILLEIEIQKTKSETPAHLAVASRELASCCGSFRASDWETIPHHYTAVEKQKQTHRYALQSSECSERRARYGYPCHTHTHTHRPNQKPSQLSAIVYRRAALFSALRVAFAASSNQ